MSTRGTANGPGRLTSGQCAQFRPAAAIDHSYTGGLSQAFYTDWVWNCVSFRCSIAEVAAGMRGYSHAHDLLLSEVG